MWSYGCGSILIPKTKERSSISKLFPPLPSFVFTPLFGVGGVLARPLTALLARLSLISHEWKSRWWGHCFGWLTENSVVKYSLVLSPISQHVYAYLTRHVLKSLRMICVRDGPCQSAKAAQTKKEMGWTPESNESLNTGRTYSSNLSDRCSPRYSQRPSSAFVRICPVGPVGGHCRRASTVEFGIDPVWYLGRRFLEAVADL